jgi:hypothetical protein
VLVRGSHGEVAEVTGHRLETLQHQLGLRSRLPPPPREHSCRQNKASALPQFSCAHLTKPEGVSPEFAVHFNDPVLYWQCVRWFILGPVLGFVAAQAVLVLVGRLRIPILGGAGLACGSPH